MRYEVPMNTHPFHALLAITLLLPSCGSLESSGDPSDSRYEFVRGDLPNHLGRVTAADSGSRCSLSTTAPSKSPLKRQQIQFYIEYTSFSSDYTDHRFVVSTGASKSQADVQALLGNGLRRAPQAAEGTELAKIGAIELGGEMRLIVRGGGKVEFAYNPALPSRNPVLSPGEAAAFADLLTR